MVTATITAVKRRTIRTTSREWAWKILKRIFSGSNQLASVVRYASAYRCRQFIDLYLQQWDADKYENLATWLYNNYVQATKIIDEEILALEHAMQSLGIAGTEELDCWQAEELEYLQTL